MQVRLWNVEKLQPYLRNPRKNDGAVDRMMASIREFGFKIPVLARSDGEVVDGHLRLKAAQRLGIQEVGVILCDEWTPAQVKAFRLMVNRSVGWAEWDQELLGLELADLKDLNFDLDLTGFNLDEIDDLLSRGESNPGLTDEDEVPEVPQTPLSKAGDLWVLDKHRVLCADATRVASLERVLAGGFADMAFTDPPYNVDYAQASTHAGRGGRKIVNDHLGSAFEEFLSDACRNLLEVTKGAIYICMSSSEIDTLKKAFTAVGGHWSTFVIWAKNTFTLGRSDYQRQYEPILYGWKEGTKHFWCGARDQGDVWFVKKPVSNDLHPTMKPVELIERAIGNSSKSRDTILDVFGGSGSTLIACEKTGRQARIIEIDPRYVDTAVIRWQEFTGKDAILEENGQTFCALAEQRAPVTT